jgi:hypothetical protein
MNEWYTTGSTLKSDQIAECYAALHWLLPEFESEIKTNAFQAALVASYNFMNSFQVAGNLEIT